MRRRRLFLESRRGRILCVMALIRRCLRIFLSGVFHMSGLLAWVEFDKQVFVAVRRSEGEAIRDRFVKTGSHWIDLRRGRHRSEGGHALVMFDEERERGQAGLHG